MGTLKKAEGKADVIEIWFDEIKGLSEKNITELFKNSSKPILYKYQGGDHFEEIMKNKPTYIDIDLSAPKNLIRKINDISPKTKIIISHHDFKKTPETKEVKKIISKMIRKGADIIKIATQANKITDGIRMLSILSQLNSPAIIICMGKEGRITRTTGHLFGNYLMYAPLTKGERTAEGQLTVNELKEIINIY